MVRLKFSERQKKKLTQTGIKMLVLFGSEAQKLAHENSDVDILVFGPDNKQAYDTVYNLISEKVNRLTDIDIVFAQRAPMELLNQASKYGHLIYSQRAQEFADFRQRVMLIYSDFAPYRKKFQQATLARI